MPGTKREGGFLGALEIIVRHPVQCHRADLALRHAGPGLRIIQCIEVEFGKVLGLQHLAAWHTPNFRLLSVLQAMKDPNWSPSFGPDWLKKKT